MVITMATTMLTTPKIIVATNPKMMIVEYAGFTVIFGETVHRNKEENQRYKSQNADDA